MGYGSQKAPQRLSLAPSIPAGLALAELGWHWETRARSGCGCLHPRLVPRGGGKPPHQLLVPEPHPSTVGGRDQGLALEVPAGLLGGGGPALAPQLRTAGQGRAADTQNAPAHWPQPFPGSKWGAEAAPRDACVTNAPVTIPTPKGAGPARRLGDVNVLDLWPWVSEPSAATLPSCLTQHHPQHWAAG